MMNERDQFSQAVDKLLKTDHGLGIWCGFRHAVGELMSHEGYEEIGSSDVSNRCYQYWLDRKRSNGQTRITDGLQFTVYCDIQSNYGGW
tara:strand:- start:123 stop:389 length:267 start_codon:yes stop_codon:yes gene_type:complete